MAGIPRPMNPFIGGLPMGDMSPLFNPIPMPQQRPPFPQLPQAIPQQQAAPPMPMPAPQVPQMGAASMMPMPPPQGGGLKAGVQNFLENDALAFASGVLGGGSTSEALGRGFGLVAANRNNQGGQDMPEAYQLWQLAGSPGQFGDWYMQTKKAGAVNVDNRQMGNIPPGYEVERDAAGNPIRMKAIPGGPEDKSAADEERQGQDDVATRVITTAAQRARDAAAQRWTGPYGQDVAGIFPQTASADAARQVAALKAAAKTENLQAMRQSSPTGGALGNVSNQDIQMLAEKSGALDPASPTFLRDLDDYELTLLQVIHGPRAGQLIFQETRQIDPEAELNGLLEKYGAQ